MHCNPAWPEYLTGQNILVVQQIASYQIGAAAGGVEVAKSVVPPGPEIVSDFFCRHGQWLYRRGTIFTPHLHPRQAFPVKVFCTLHRTI